MQVCTYMHVCVHLYMCVCMYLCMCNNAFLQYIISRLNQLDCNRWEITLDTFTDIAPHPFGEKNFTNIIATLDPTVDKRLVLAAHYDSKFFEKGAFLGATDSAVPVALLLDLALTLDEKLQKRAVSHMYHVCIDYICHMHVMSSLGCDIINVWCHVVCMSVCT